MDAEPIRRPKPMLTRFLKRFDNCFARIDTKAHMPVCAEGQLSELDKKNVEVIAKRARTDGAGISVAKYSGEHNTAR